MAANFEISFQMRLISGTCMNFNYVSLLAIQQQSQWGAL